MIDESRGEWIKYPVVPSAFPPCFPSLLLPSLEQQTLAWRVERERRELKDNNSGSQPGTKISFVSGTHQHHQIPENISQTSLKGQANLGYEINQNALIHVEQQHTRVFLLKTRVCSIVPLSLLYLTSNPIYTWNKHFSRNSLSSPEKHVLSSCVHFNHIVELQEKGLTLMAVRWLFGVLCMTIYNLYTELRVTRGLKDVFIQNFNPHPFLVRVHFTLPMDLHFCLDEWSFIFFQQNKHQTTIDHP